MFKPWLSAIVVCGAALGQPVGRMSFEVASIRPATPPTGQERLGGLTMQGGPGTASPDQITWRYATLRSVLQRAYDVQPYQLIGPDWLNMERFDFAVTVPPGATVAAVNQMWQNLLAERFGVRVHTESREFQVDEMVVGKDGHKLKESTEAVPEGLPQAGMQMKNGKVTGPGMTSPGMVTMMRLDPSGPRAQLMAKSQTLAQLATSLSNQLKHPVADKTALTGKYDFTIEYTPDIQWATPPANVGFTASEPAIDIAVAMQKQLGLRLVSSKGKLNVIIVDQATKVPTEN